MHRLLPLPVTAEPYTPPLEVYLKGDDPHLGLRRPLHIHSISAILGERSHVLLLPISRATVFTSVLKCGRFKLVY
jgi:hypothetical protein